VKGRQVLRLTRLYNDDVAAPDPLELEPEIDEFRQQFERLSAAADELVMPLTDEQFNWQPAPGAWSVAECIEHLNITARMYLPRLDEGIAEATRRGLYGPGPFTHDLIGKFFVRTMAARPSAHAFRDHGRIPRLPGAVRRPSASGERTRPEAGQGALAGDLVDQNVAELGICADGGTRTPPFVAGQPRPRYAGIS
jgi:hypothetical protein